MQRFWNKVEKIPFHECWEWTAGCSPDGYGKFKINKKTVRAHRFSYEIHNGPIGPNLEVCHSCDNIKCVNPYHLFLGSRVENHRDMLKKGRGVSGEKNGSSKLTKVQIKDIRQAYRSGDYTQQQIAWQYGITQNMVSKIVLYRCWK